MTWKQLGEFHGLITTAFSESDLAQLAAFELGIDLYTLVTKASVNEMAFGLIVWAVQHGRTDELLHAAAEGREKREDLSKFRDKVLNTGGDSAVIAPDSTADALRVTPGAHYPPDSVPAKPRSPFLARLSWYLFFGLLVVDAAVGVAIFYFNRPVVVKRTESSPLDFLDRSAIPSEQMPLHHVDGLVAVLGSGKSRSWTGSWVAIRPDGAEIRYAEDFAGHSVLDLSGPRDSTPTRRYVPTGNATRPRLYSADGKRMLVAGGYEESALTEFDSSGGSTRQLKLAEQWVVFNTCTRSTDGGTVAAITSSGSISVIDWPNAGSLTTRCNVPAGRPDSRFRLSADGKRLALLKATTFHEPPKTAVDGPPSMPSVAGQVRTDFQIEVWDVSGRTAAKMCDLPGDEGKPLGAKPWLYFSTGDASFDFLPDGRLLALHRDKKVRLWAFPIATGHPVATCVGGGLLGTLCGATPSATVIEPWGEPEADDSSAIRVSPAGDVVAIANGKRLAVYRTAARGKDFGEKAAAAVQLEGNEYGYPATSMEFADHGRKLLTRHADRSFHLWEVTQEGLIRTFGPEAVALDHFGLTPEGDRFLGGSLGGGVRYRFRGEAPEPDGRVVTPLHGLWGDLRLGWTERKPGLEFFHPLDEKKRGTLAIPDVSVGAIDQTASAVLAEQLPFTGSVKDGVAWRCWGMTNDKLTQMGTLPQTPARPLLTFGNGQHVLTVADVGGDANTPRKQSVELWTLRPANGGTFEKTDSFDIPAEKQSPVVNAAAPAPTDVTTVVLSTGQVLEVANGKFQKRDRLPLDDFFYSPHVAVSPDGKKVAFAGRVSVWDIATGQREYMWPAPLIANKVLFSRDGRHLLTGNSNGTVFVIRLPTEH